jgi:signal peptidase I
MGGTVLPNFFDQGKNPLIVMQDRTKSKRWPKWRGVIASILVPGAGLYLAGKRREGMAWLAFCAVATPAVLAFAAVEKVPALLVIGALVGASLAQIAMLVRSYRPTRQLQWYGWVAVLTLGSGFHYSEKFAVYSSGRTFSIPTSSMAPTITSVDYVMSSRATYWLGVPLRGDIVAFLEPDPKLGKNAEFYAKRIVGLPGDVLSSDGREILVNGQRYLRPGSSGFLRCYPGSPFLGHDGDSLKLPSNAVFLLGDNSGQSEDSRFYGPVPLKNIVGKIELIYWPARRVGRIQ